MICDKRLLAGENRINGANRGHVPAGGASSRFGSDQSLAEIGGVTALARMSQPIESEAGCVNYRGNGRPMSWLARAATVADRWPGKGHGVELSRRSMLRKVSIPGREWNVIVSCDMPFLTREWLSCKVQRALASDAEMIVPAVGAQRRSPFVRAGGPGARQSDRRYDTLAH